MDDIQKMKTELSIMARKGFLQELNTTMGYHKAVNKFDEQNQKIYYKSKSSSICYGFGQFVEFVVLFIVRIVLVYYVKVLYKESLSPDREANGFKGAFMEINDIIAYLIYLF